MKSEKNIVIMHNKLSVYDTLNDIMSSKFNCIFLKSVAGEFRKIPEDIKVDLFIIDLTEVSKADILYISDRLNSRPYDYQPVIYSGSYYSNSVFKSKLNKLHELVFISGNDMESFNVELNEAFNRFGFDIQVDVTQAVSQPVNNNRFQAGAPGGSVVKNNNGGSSKKEPSEIHHEQDNRSGAQTANDNHVIPGNSQNINHGQPVVNAGMNYPQGYPGGIYGQGYPAGMAHGYPQPYTPGQFQQYNTDTHVKLEMQDKPLVMVIDDDVNILTTVAKYLRKDYNVVSVRSTALAFMKIGVRKPDLILLDYMIPVCDGKQTLQMIRNQFETSKIPVIMLTSFTEKERVLQCFELGISGYMVKPVSKDDLLQAVNGVFKR